MAKKPERLLSHINGEWRQGTGEHFESFNPAHHKQILAEGNEAGPEQVAQAVVAADRAYDEWRLTPAPVREEYFYRMLNFFGDPTNPDNEVIREWAEVVARECGKTYNESRADLVEGIHMLRVVAAKGRDAIGEVIPSEFAEKFSFTKRVPRGPTAVISPWNFPFAIPLWMLGPAAMMGNTVVFKPSEQTPLVGQKVMELCEKVGFPPGVINFVQGGRAPGDALVRDPRIRTVLFTGSYPVGHGIKKICAEDPLLDKLAVLETGSKSGIIMLDDADLAMASEATYQSAFKTTGQRCLSTSRVFVPRSKLSRFEDLLMRDIEAHVREGDPMDPGIFMGPLINKPGLEKVAHYNDLVMRHQRRKGLRVLLEGEMDSSEGYFAKPFVYVVDQYDPGFPPLREEVFGPHLAIIPVDDADEAVRRFQDAPFNLAMSVITKGFGWYEILEKLRHKGIFYVNLLTVGAEVQLPFGGTLRSGCGMPSAVGMFDNVTQKMAVTVNTSDVMQLAQGMTK